MLYVALKIYTALLHYDQLDDKNLYVTHSESSYYANRGRYVRDCMCMTDTNSRNDVSTVLSMTLSNITIESVTLHELHLC